MTEQGQLFSFEGKEVTALKLSIPGMGDVDYMLPPDEDAGTLRQGDQFEVLVRYVVVDVRHPEKHDSLGIATEKMKRVQVAKTVVPEIVKVEAVLRRESIERMWEHDTHAVA